MLNTKLYPPLITSDFISRPELIQKLDKKRSLPLILVTAPAGYGKSILISQWLEKQEGNYGWLSIDESMNDTSTFLTYFAAVLDISSSVGKSRLKNLDRENHFLVWQAIIEVVVNRINEFKEPFKLILDDYHLIRNQEIHRLFDAILHENIRNFQLVIITRRDPPLHLRTLRIYQKMLEIRSEHLRFNENDLGKLLTKEQINNFTKQELNELITHTEGWILAIRLMVAARSFPASDGKNEKSLAISNDLDSLLNHICSNLDAAFFRQIQLCSLCDQFNKDLISSIFTCFHEDSISADIFLHKLSELNFFLIPVSTDGTWYRFHHLIGDMLSRRIEQTDPTIIKPVYLKISEWFSDNDLVDNAIHYAIKAKDYDLACNQILKHWRNIIEQEQWWVLQRWLDKIPRQIRKANVDLLLMELLVCEETWNLEDFSAILDTLESIGIENSNAENISNYLFHLGYFLTFIKQNAKKSAEALERSKKLYYDESALFGARRELILATARQMLGLTALALKALDDIQKKFERSSSMHIRAIHGRTIVHLLSADFKSANIDSKKFMFIVQDSDFIYEKGWVSYFRGNVCFQSFNEFEAIHSLKEALAFEGLFNYRAYFDALAGLILFSSLKGDENATELFLIQMSQLAAKLKDTKFQHYYFSIKARVSWHNGQGDKELDWALADWVKQSPSSYFFLMDVPELSKIRIIVSHGSVLQVEEALNVLEEVETFLNNLHNKYHIIDIELLKAIALLRVGREEDSIVALNKALILAEKEDMIRPIIEVHRVMPSLFSLIKDLTISHRILARIALKPKNIESRLGSVSKIEGLSNREKDVIQLIAEGLRNKEIADQLNISTITVKSHLTNIYRKLGVSNRTSMLKKVRDRGI